MKIFNFILLVFLISSLTSLVSAQNALNCQYKDKQDTGQTITYLQDNEGNNYTNPIEVRDFVSTQRCPYTAGCAGGVPCSCKISFVVRNLINKQVTLKIQYTITHSRINGYSVQSTVIHNDAKEINIDPLSNYLVQGEYSDDTIGCNDQECSVNTDSIRYSFISNDETTSKTDKVYQDICKMCGDKICLNDGEKCANDYECGSATCNIAGLCGKEKVIDCPIGLKNCNNQSCLKPSTIRNGEKYLCEWECKGGVGEAGLCKQSLKELILKGLFILTFLILLIGITYYTLRKQTQ